MKVILNKCYGGFSVSDKAYELYAKKKGIQLYRYVESDAGIKYLMRYGIDGKPHYISYYFTKDYGNVVKGTDIDWGDNIYLDRGHREDPVLAEVVEELGGKADGQYSKLKVVDIPDGMDYVIDDYDGFETLHQRVEEW